MILYGVCVGQVLFGLVILVLLVDWLEENLCKVKELGSLIEFLEVVDVVEYMLICNCNVIICDMFVFFINFDCV